MKLLGPWISIFSQTKTAQWGLLGNPVNTCFVVRFAVSVNIPSK